MNISQKIILPAVAVIFISWVELNAKADTDKVQPQKSIDRYSITQCSETINTNVKSCFTSPDRLVNRDRQV